MTQTYHFGVPAKLVWTSHILMGLFFLYLGYLLIEKKPISKYISITIIIIGVLAVLYHGHLYYYYKNKEDEKVVE